MNLEAAAEFVEGVLARIALDGVSALRPLIGPDAQALFTRFCDEFGLEQRPLFQLAAGSVVSGGAAEVHFLVRRAYRASAYFARDARGTWRPGRRSVRDALRSSDAVVGLPDDCDSVSKLAGLLARGPAAKRLRVYLGGCRQQVSLAVYTGFAASLARLAEAQVLACRPDERIGRAGEVVIEGRESPVEIGLGLTDGRITSVSGATPAAFFRNWLRASGAGLPPGQDGARAGTNA